MSEQVEKVSANAAAKGQLNKDKIQSSASLAIVKTLFWAWKKLLEDFEQGEIFELELNESVSKPQFLNVTFSISFPSGLAQACIVWDLVS